MSFLRSFFRTSNVQTRTVDRPAPPDASYDLEAEEAGYSLLELMIVIVIIGILALIAIPKFTGVTTKAKMTEAKTMLRQVYTLQKAHYFERDRYGSDLAAIGFEQTPLVSDGGTARYVIAIEDASTQDFVATATAVVDYDNDEVFNVWEVQSDGAIVERTPD